MNGNLHQWTSGVHSISAPKMRLLRGLCFLSVFAFFYNDATSSILNTIKVYYIFNFKNNRGEYSVGRLLYLDPVTELHLATPEAVNCGTANY